MNENKQNRAKDFFASGAGKLVIMLVAMFVLYGIMLLCVNMNLPMVTLGIAIGCGYFGWKALSAITPNLFLIMPIGGWVVYYLIKGLLSVLIGFFVAPFQIARLLSDRIQNGMHS